eukprot:m.207613 g.207613  ORF g.207613 m.207613 type:complete len:221 (-) comp18931_c0_seq1:304-966(-)
MALTNTMTLRAFETAPPLDYSFSELATIKDMLEGEPRAGKTKTQLEAEQEKTLHRLEKKNSERQFSLEEEKRTSVPMPEQVSVILKLNNNTLASLAGLDIVAPAVLARPELLTMIDLSFNKFTIIPTELGNFPVLNIVYLHGNRIKSLSETDKLSKCGKLRTLTVHGNPLDKTKDYRLYIISAHRSLRSLNFTSITDKERERSRIWQRLNAPKKKRNGDC